MFMTFYDNIYYEDGYYPEMVMETYNDSEVKLRKHMSFEKENDQCYS